MLDACSQNRSRCECAFDDATGTRMALRFCGRPTLIPHGYPRFCDPKNPVDAKRTCHSARFWRGSSRRCQRFSGNWTKHRKSPRRSLSDSTTGRPFRSTRRLSAPHSPCALRVAKRGENRVGTRYRHRAKTTSSSRRQGWPSTRSPRCLTALRLLASRCLSKAYSRSFHGNHEEIPRCQRAHAASGLQPWLS